MGPRVRCASWERCEVVLTNEVSCYYAVGAGHYERTWANSGTRHKPHLCLIHPADRSLFWPLPLLLLLVASVVTAILLPRRIELGATNPNRPPSGGQPVWSVTVATGVEAYLA